MSNGSPLVSIVIPAYNVDRYLKQCLDSVARQTVDAIEVICVDDGSTDGSASIIDAFADKDSRFVAIHQPNGGYGKAVNTGLSLAKGSYVGIVESDDFIDESMFEMLFSAARRHGFPDVVKAAYWRVCNPDTPEQQMIPAYYYHRVSHVDEPFTLSDDAELLFHHPSIWSAIYRRDFLQARDIRMREEPGAAWVDNPFLMETLVQANAIVYLDQPLYYYREFSIGSSSSVKDPSIVYER